MTHAVMEQARAIGQASRHLERVQWKDMAKREVEIPLRGCINLNEHAARPA